MKKYSLKYFEKKIIRLEEWKKKYSKYIDNNEHIQDVKEYNQRNKIRKLYTRKYNELKSEIEEFEKMDKENQERVNVKKFFKFD